MNIYVPVARIPRVVQRNAQYAPRVRFRHQRVRHIVRHAQPDIFARLVQRDWVSVPMGNTPMLAVAAIVIVIHAPRGLCVYREIYTRVTRVFIARWGQHMK